MNNLYYKIGYLYFAVSWVRLALPVDNMILDAVKPEENNGNTRTKLMDKIIRQLESGLMLVTSSFIRVTGLYEIMNINAVLFMY